MEFIKSCDQMAVAVEDAIHDLVGTPEGGRMIRMGADGTPTKLIDQVAEDCVVDLSFRKPALSYFDQRGAGKT